MLQRTINNLAYDAGLNLNAVMVDIKLVPGGSGEPQHYQYTVKVPDQDVDIAEEVVSELRDSIMGSSKSGVGSQLVSVFKRAAKEQGISMLASVPLKLVSGSEAKNKREAQKQSAYLWHPTDAEETANITDPEKHSTPDVNDDNEPSPFGVAGTRYGAGGRGSRGRGSRGRGGGAAAAAIAARMSGGGRGMSSGKGMPGGRGMSGGMGMSGGRGNSTPDSASRVKAQRSWSHLRMAQRMVKLIKTVRLPCILSPNK